MFLFFFSNFLAFIHFSVLRPNVSQIGIIDCLLNCLFLLIIISLSVTLPSSLKDKFALIKMCSQQSGNGRPFFPRLTNQLTSHFFGHQNSPTRANLRNLPPLPHPPPLHVEIRADTKAKASWRRTARGKAKLFPFIIICWVWSERARAREIERSSASVLPRKTLFWREGGWEALFSFAPNI